MLITKQSVNRIYNIWTLVFWFSFPNVMNWLLCSESSQSLGYFAALRLDQVQQFLRINSTPDIISLMTFWCGPASGWFLRERR